jgi:hypothetical protein
MTETPQTDQPDVFDPAEHTVDEVKDYLDGQHPDEVARVLAAEEAGKARTTLLASPVAAAVEALEPQSVEELLGDDNPYELVRAKDAASGAEYTTSRVAALNAGSTVLAHKRAVDDFGTPIPTKTVLDLRAEANPTDAEADRSGNDLPKE